MSGMFGVGYFILVALVVVLGLLLRRWYAVSQDRAQLVFWVMFVLLCPPLALIVFLILKVLRITIVVRTENSSHG